MDRTSTFQYLDLHRPRFAKFANGLRSLGIKKVIVSIYSRYTKRSGNAELFRIGATHSVVFGGFPPKAFMSAFLMQVQGCYYRRRETAGRQSQPFETAVDAALAMGKTTP